MENKLNSEKIDNLFPVIKKVEGAEPYECYQTRLRVKCDNGKWYITTIKSSNPDLVVKAVYTQLICAKITEPVLGLKDFDDTRLFIEDEVQYSEEDRLMKEVDRINAEFNKKK